MNPIVEFIFDVVSPNGYLAWYPLRDIVARHGAKLKVTPVFLGGMHKLTGNAPPMIRDADVKGKVEYSMLEMRRFIAWHGFTKFRLHPQFPFNSVTFQRMLLAVEGEDRLRLVEALLPAIWEEGMAVDDADAIAAMLRAAGFDPQALLAATKDAGIKQQLIDNTEAAVARGAFGIPTFYVDTGAGPEMFFGKERLGQIEDMLAAGRA
ncbi:2-hydroxychromene-2-carboxylate isomerase [Parerythrobacter aurantius]|uniref:2-hydroxychromene-2-carboxylate isomerase n=1 Tax=Parerythrobacter aurantius TaxID=3127706 RepID=UPI003249DD33